MYKCLEICLRGSVTMGAWRTLPLGSEIGSTLCSRGYRTGWWWDLSKGCRSARLRRCHCFIVCAAKQIRRVAMKRTIQIAKTIASQRHRSKRMRPISDRQSSIHGPAISKAWKMNPGSHRINCHDRVTACKMQRMNPSTSIIAMAWAMASRNKRRTSRYELTGGSML